MLENQYDMFGAGLSLSSIAKMMGAEGTHDRNKTKTGTV